MLMLKNKKGQSTIEYVVMATAVITVIIIVTQGVFKTRVQETVEQSATDMELMSDRLADSYGVAAE